MNQKLSALTLGILCSTQAFAFDTETLGMGGVGVAIGVGASTANLNASQLVTQPGPSVDIRVPIIGGNISDEGDLVNKIDDIQSLVSKTNQSLLTPTEYLDFSKELSKQLDNIAKSEMPRAQADVGMAVSVLGETDYAGAFYLHGQAETIVDVDIADNGDGYLDYMDSTVTLSAAGKIESGFALAKRMDYNLHTFGVSITPKVQNLRLYSKTFSIDDFDISDFAKDYDSKTAFNADLGASYRYGQYSLGFVVNDLFKQEVTSNETGHSAYVDRKVRLGLGYTGSFYRYGLDVDLASYRSLGGYEQQKVKFGGEIVPWGRLAMRAGISHDLKSSQTDLSLGGAITVGPYVTAHVGAVAGTNRNLGATAELAFMF
ncbi:conjugal transfer protein TraF [Vibrio barjaei]|uniref:conjugal transfer protein TraF n=1 Tax=Vibrio barjaei TaxID=1676683 RepID=UPI0022835823|nr:conjugal transfer protein TraF [Vibrio barjaei]MCY9872379.1 conjugal transfer protein TraF [Vibrio barjaei]